MLYRISLLALGLTWMSLPLLPSAQQTDENRKTNTSKPALLVKLCDMQTNLIHESSGVARASKPGYLWTVNDSGNAAEVYLLGPDGNHRATLKLRGVKNVDWESMATFEKDGSRYLIVGDVGDNLKRRKTCVLYIVPEPKPVLKSNQIVELEVKPVALEYTYEGGPRNCEAVAVDTTNNQIVLIEKVYADAKQKEKPTINALPLRLESTQQPLIAKKVGTFPVRNVTGMDISPDGKKLIVRNYINAHLFSKNDPNTRWETVLSGFKPTNIPCPLQRQAEAVCFSEDGEAIILTSEKTRQAIWQVNIAQQIK